MSDNNFLLDWAVENLQEWDDAWEHLRCDYTGIFFTKLPWEINSYENWCISTVDARSGVNYLWLCETVDSSRPLQAITKQDWLNAKKEKEQMNNSFTKKDLKTGMVVVTHESAYRVMLGTEHGDVLIDLNDDQYNTLSEYTEGLKSNWESLDKFDIVAVYSSKCPEHSRFHYGNENPAYTLIWERKPEVNTEAKELQRIVDKLTQELKDAQKKLEQIGVNK